MTASVIRRLERLEAGDRGHPMAGVAEALEAARKRARTMTPEELRRENEQELVAMRAAHAIKPLRGLALWLLNAAERMQVHDAQDRAQPEAGAR